MSVGLGAALRKGPDYLLSFVIVFLATQSIGGVIGGGIFNTLVNWRQAFHLQTLYEQLGPSIPRVTAEVAQRMSAFASQISDTAARRAQAVSQLAQEASAQAFVMAYNDLYFIIFLLAAMGLFFLALHMARDRMVARVALRHSPSEPGSPT